MGRRRKKRIGVLGIIFAPLLFVGWMMKATSNLARPYYGRYGTKSIAKRKRR